MPHTERCLQGDLWPLICWLYGSRGILYIEQVNSLGQKRLQKTGCLSWVALTLPFCTALSSVCLILYEWMHAGTLAAVANFLLVYVTPLLLGHFAFLQRLAMEKTWAPELVIQPISWPQEAENLHNPHAINKHYRNIVMIFPKLDGSCCQSLDTNLHLCLNELSSAVTFRSCSSGGRWI